MYKRLTILAAVAVCAVALSSCKSLSVIPQATNTVATATFADLNLVRDDYIVLNTITAEATLNAHFTDISIKVEDPNGDFSMSWVKPKFGGSNSGNTGGWVVDKVKGVMCLGYLSNDYGNELFEVGPYPHWIVRRLAMYRLINAAKIAGGDGVIEPIISTNVEQGKSYRDVVYKTTVSAKVIKIKPDGK